VRLGRGVGRRGRRSRGGGRGGHAELVAARVRRTDGWQRGRRQEVPDGLGVATEEQLVQVVRRVSQGKPPQGVRRQLVRGRRRRQWHLRGEPGGQSRLRKRVVEQRCAAQPGEDLGREPVVHDECHVAGGR
jgi:hypothetical protein